MSIVNICGHNITIYCNALMESTEELDCVLSVAREPFYNVGYVFEKFPFLLHCDPETLHL